MPSKKIDAWIDTHKDDTANGLEIYSKLRDTMEIEGLAHQTKTSFLNQLHLVIKLNPELDYKNLTEDDITKILISLLKKYDKPKTQQGLKLAFRKWLKVSKQDHLLHLIKTTIKRTREKLPEDMITPDEVEAMLKNCINPRDQAIIATLYDTGCRIGEMLSMRVRDVVFDDNGAVVTYPEGKTGWRKNRVVFASSYLRVWLNNHELAEDPEAPLFYSLKGKAGGNGKRKIQHVKYEGVRRAVKRAADRAGIKKRIHLHLFRHTRATELANHLTEQQLKKQFGWTQSSSMAARYVHLTDRDVDKAILKASGIKVEEEETNQKLKPIKCPRCREFNPANAAFCMRCGLSFTKKIEDKEKDLAQKMAEIIKEHPELLKGD
jgi:integrase